MFLETVSLDAVLPLCYTLKTLQRSAGEALVMQAELSQECVSARRVLQKESMAYPLINHPEEIFQHFVSRINDGDVDAALELFEDDAALWVQRDQEPFQGHEQIRQSLQSMVDAGQHLDTDGQRPTLVAGDLALTSAELGPGVVTAEVARRQPDGTWRWVIDTPSFFEATE